MMAKSNLKDILVQFLREEEVYYPQTEITILSENPFQFTDDSQFYFESQNLQEVYYEGKQKFPGETGIKLILKEWHFVFRRVPNTHDYYFDIVCSGYDYVPNEMPTETLPGMKKVIMDDMVKYAFEVRKRKLISQFIKNEQGGGGMDLGFGAGSKLSKANARNPSLPSGSKIDNGLLLVGDLLDCNIDEEGIVCDREVLGEMGMQDYLNTPGDLGKRDRDYDSSGQYRDDDSSEMCQESNDEGLIEDRVMGGKKIFF